MRKIFATTVAVVSLVGLQCVATAASHADSVSGPSPLTTTEAKALSVGATHRVIVVMKDQLSSVPDTRSQSKTRRADEASIQKPIVSELSQTKAKSVKSYTVINAVTATVSAGEETRLAQNPAVAEVIPDQIIKLGSALDAESFAAKSDNLTPAPGTCPAPGAPPLLEPQALSTIHADSSDPHAKTARSLGLTGAGVTVGFIADGLDINNQDFIRNGHSVFVDYKDFSGEGTSVPTGGGEAFLDASSIAAQGTHVYDISQYSALSMSHPCDIRIEGVAPGVNMVGLDIFGAEDAGFNSSFLQAIDYAVSTDHVNVLNESLGNNYYPDDAASLDLIKAANDAAVAAGTTVTVSSGDAGVTSTIGTPATDPNVISAGASTTYQTPAQLGYGGAQFGITGWVNNNISALSSSGYEQNGSTISLVAPGELNWALCSTDTTMYDECTNYQGNPSPVQESGGTSESAPLTAGVAALVIQAYKKTHGNALPSPALVKQFITSTADDISAPADLQGSGLIDAYRASLAAEDYRATPVRHSGATLLESTSQFNAVAPTGTPEQFTENLTNVGSSPETVGLSSRTLGAYSSIDTATVTLSDTASPHSMDYQGYDDNYEMVHFVVPSGVDRLNGSIAFQGASANLSSRVRLSLIDPLGRLADYSLPQGVGNYGDAQVADPVPGTWTAYIWSRPTSTNPATSGTTGPVVFGASVAKYQSFGGLSSNFLTINPGSTRSVTLNVATPSQPGDTSGSLVVSSSGQAALAIPVTLRSLAPAGPTSISGVLTGGNGRASFTGVTKYYQLDVPRHSPELNASITLADNPNNQTYIWLVDPSGQAQAFQSNGLVTEDSGGNLSYTNTLGANAHVLNPAAGRWTVIIVFAPTVSGTALSEDYTLSLNEFPPAAFAIGVPQGQFAGVHHPAVAFIKVTNTGTAPEAYFVDARTNATATYPLPSISSSVATVPLSAFASIPYYEVPSETSQIVGTATTTGSTPIQFDLGAPTGDPDVASGQGPSVSASVTGNPVTAGVWDLAPDVVGPYGPAAATSETVNTTLTATAQAFDPAVTTAAGDLWLSAIGGPELVSPVIVQPGHSTFIKVVIAPTGPFGSTVSGTLYLDDDSLFSLYGGLSPNANTDAAFHYSYRVGS
jgi:hypothetical protein